jgi:2-amino-4-hydroxy-6-hydroxymethyldihydropteridine diphosphokinase
VSGAARRRAFLSLGANLGDREASLRAATAELGAAPETELVAVSPVYETAPQDLADQPAFLNQVVCVDTGLSPHALLTECQAIEERLGRRRTVRFGPRSIDVDILLYEGVQSDDAELTLPHPRMWQRAFVLVPLARLWSLARGMPVADVEGLAAGLAVTQPVELFSAAEE